MIENDMNIIIMFYNHENGLNAIIVFNALENDMNYHNGNDCHNDSKLNLECSHMLDVAPINRTTCMVVDHLVFVFFST